MSLLGRRGAVVSALVFALAFGVAAAATVYGTLYVSTLPAGANVWIDGTYVGKSPVLVDSLARGHHAVTLTKSGWLVQDEDVQVSAGSTNMVSYRLRSDVRKSAWSHGSGTVSLRGLAAADRVLIDGERVADPGSPMPLAAGTHVALVTASGRKLIRTFTVYPDTTTDVILADVLVDDHPSGIVAPAEEFLPDDAYRVAGKKVVVRYGGHQVLATLGEPAMRLDGVAVSYDAVPSRINGKLYLPLALLTRLTSSKAK